MSTQVLAGRAAVITGASQGLGREIARQFVRDGASVVICARQAETLTDAASELESLVSAEGQTVTSLAADVSHEDDVHRLRDAALAAHAQIHALVLNAGVYGPMGAIEDVSWAEWTHALEVNLYGSVLPCRAFVPHFKSQRYGKIVQISGGGATSPLPRISAYAASKAAVVRFAETLAEELRSDGVDVNAIAPGALDTRLLDLVIEAGPEKIGADFYGRMTKVKAQGGTPLTVGAALASYLSSVASDGITGKLISAPWDPWETLATHRDALATSDIYTLRRIVPADRGQTWGEREGAK